MCQQPLDKAVVLLHQICLAVIIGIYHIVDKLLELFVFNFKLLAFVPLDLLMLRTL